MENDPKHTAKATQEFLKVKNVEYSALAKSISWFQPNWACISLVEDKTKGRKTHKQTQTISAYSAEIMKIVSANIYLVVSKYILGPNSVYVYVQYIYTHAHTH